MALACANTEKSVGPRVDAAAASLALNLARAFSFLSTAFIHVATAAGAGLFRPHQSSRARAPKTALTQRVTSIRTGNAYHTTVRTKQLRHYARARWCHRHRSTRNARLPILRDAGLDDEEYCSAELLH